MADDIDTDNDYAERLNAEALDKRTRYSGHSAHACIDCGEPIPEERRAAIAGVNTCAECATIREKQL